MNKELKQWLSDYDSGKRMKTVSMGGLGNGYECAIHDCAIETMRNLQEVEIPVDKKEFNSVVEKAGEQACAKLRVVHGFSGAQVGAAKNMAAIFWNKTPSVAVKQMEEHDKERIIEVWKGENNLANVSSD